jgi:hypothetical protein
VPTIRAVAVGENVRPVRTAFDLILDVLCDDAAGARAFLEHAAYRDASALVARVTKHEWTARITHTVRLG